MGLPPRVDLRGQCPPVYNQGQLGSCTANATGAAHQFEQRQQAGAKNFAPSRLMIYYEARVALGQVDRDGGAYLRDCFKSIAKKGVCPESLWPYVPAKFAMKPPKECYTEGKKHQAVKYQRVSIAEGAICAVLAAGNLVAFGAMLYQSFMAAWPSGKIPMPSKTERAVGGHAMALVGYDTARRIYIVRNSWGAGNAMKGYHEMPFDYIHDDNLTADFWMVSRVEV